jgi:hypothetical protein
MNVIRVVVVSHTVSSKEEGVCFMRQHEESSRFFPLSLFRSLGSFGLSHYFLFLMLMMSVPDVSCIAWSLLMSERAKQG